MAYLEISNIGEITKNSIELLGFSDKRSHKQLIGEKGTGLKFSRLQCLRQGIDVVVSTPSFMSRFITEPIDVENERVIFEYSYKNGKKAKVNSNYTVQAGFGDWTEAWFIVREFFQNAVDEMVRGEVCKDSREAMELVCKASRVVEEPSYAKNGNTNVYIQLTDSIREVFNSMGKYFVYNPVFVGKTGALHKKQVEDYIRIYKQGILVTEDISMLGKALYDYECNEISLQENRTPKATSDVIRNVLALYSEAPESYKRELFRHIKDVGADEVYEFKYTFSSRDGLSNLESWVKAFKEEYGDTVVIHYSNVVSDYIAEKVKLKGKSVIVLPKALYDFLKEDIETVTNLKATFGHGLFMPEDFTESEHAIVRGALEKLEKVFDINCRFAKYTPKYEEELGVGGIYFEKKNMILINDKCILTEKQVMQILAEELVHKESGAQDMTRGFQNCAIKKIVEALVLA